MIVELAELRDRVRIFKDRPDAGQRLAGMLEALRDTDAVVLGVATGGIPVAAAVARKLNLALDVAVVSKITLPWNTEAGFGAVAFDGTVVLNEEILDRLELSEAEKQEQIELTRAKVQKRIREFRSDQPMSDLSGAKVILVDDGIASGFTLRTAVEALRNQRAKEIVIAAPTGHQQSVEDLAELVEAVYCANVRGGWSFAVAEAYRNWRDVSEVEAMEIIKRFDRKG